jgi:CheY-like chemotaxis protein
LVLVVDDDESTYELYSEVLAQAGYAIVGADDGEGAIDAARRMHPDLIVMDVAMPKLDGCEATRRLKSDESTKDIPIVVVTGYLQERIVRAARAAGCDAFLAKPCHVSKLLEEIARYAPNADNPGCEILLIEDDHDIADSVAEALTDEGHRVAMVANGREALTWLEAHPPPKVILLDLMMPVMDGWQFRDLQKQDPRFAAIPIVVMSACTGRADVARLAADDVLAKPVDLHRLHAAVQRFLHAEPHRLPVSGG